MTEPDSKASETSPEEATTESKVEERSAEPPQQQAGPTSEGPPGETGSSSEGDRLEGSAIDAEAAQAAPAEAGVAPEDTAGSGPELSEPTPMTVTTEGTTPIGEAEAEGEVAAIAPEGEEDRGDEAPATEVEAASGPVASEATPETAAAEKASGDDETSSGDLSAPGGKKKRRRRRKKKGLAPGGSTDVPSESKPVPHHAPFMHLFTGSPGRKHAFSVGEVIAGRVERVEEGAIVVDLFGKASAIADVDEPRDIPVIVPTSTEEERPVAVAPEEGADDARPIGQQAPDDTAVGGDPAPSVGEAGEEPVAKDEGPSPEVAPEASTPDAQAWGFVNTETSDIPDPDLGEADTAVGARAYAEHESVHGVEPFATTAPPDQASVSSTPEPAEGPEAERSQVDAAEGEAATDASSAGDVASPAEAPAEDLSDADLTLLEPLPELPAPELGAIFRGRIGAVAESGHIAIVNRDVDKPAVRKAIRAARHNHQRVHGVVYGFNRGGFDVLVGGVRAFCPASAMSLTAIDNPTSFVGRRYEFSLPQDKGGSKKSIIVSRRNILEKEARKRARERMGELEVGEKLRGKVLEVRDYGVLVDLGSGLDGLVHMSEVSWSRGVRPNQVAQPGDEVDVQVVKIQPATRKDRFGRVSLSMRACQTDPWDLAKETLRPGAPVKGKVVRTTEFGAFIEIADNIEGLLHISELGGNKELTHAKQALQEGDEIDVVIERIDREQRRISLSKLSDADAKAIEAGEIEIGKAPRSVKPGSHVSVIVKRIEHAGAQVQVEGMLGKRGRGFIPNRELQDVRGERRKGPSQGDVIEVKVTGTERDGTLRCSVRARLLDEERRAVREYRKESAKQGLGTFGDLLKAKLGNTSDEGTR